VTDASTDLVRGGAGEFHDLRERMTQLDGRLAEREAEVASVKTDLEAFKGRYRRDVGTLYEQLDELELAIAEAELGELSQEVGGRRERAGRASDAPRPEPAPRFTSDAVRKLFRDVAKAIHPDLARDALARDRRHALMIAANRAYADGDEEQLRRILQSWEQSPEAVLGNDAASIRLRLVRRIAQLEERIAALDAELAALKSSPLWELKAKVDEAALKGRDLVGEMLAKLRREVMAATNRLHAMRPPR
jgi:uncharacterized small protein (DUF1192 family)